MPENKNRERLQEAFWNKSRLWTGRRFSQKFVSQSILGRRTQIRNQNAAVRRRLGDIRLQSCHFPMLIPIENEKYEKTCTRLRRVYGSSCELLAFRRAAVFLGPPPGGPRTVGFVL
jgi:hypothetical protein